MLLSDKQVWLTKLLRLQLRKDPCFEAVQHRGFPLSLEAPALNTDADRLEWKHYICEFEAYALSPILQRLGDGIGKL
jgi:hypothetical protein